MTDSPKENSEVRRLYRDFLQNEINLADLPRQKKDFINANFGAESPLLAWQFLPAGTLAAMLALMILIAQPVQKTVPVHFEMNPPQAAVEPAAEKAAVTPSAPPKRPSVEVRRVMSDVGPVVVYQKAFQDNSITVIWVFPGG